MKTFKQISLTVAGAFAFLAMRHDDAGLMIVAGVIAGLTWFILEWVEQQKEHKP